MAYPINDLISIEEKADSLVQLANQYGGEDNITLVLLQFSDESESR
jgi:serine/threonine protein phosphatase PrpC